MLCALIDTVSGTRSGAPEHFTGSEPGGGSTMTPTPPPLFGDAAPPAPADREARSLADLLYDGFYMVTLLRRGSLPQSGSEFRARIRSFLAHMERGAQRLTPPPAAEDVHLAKFAFCALVDELVLRAGSGFPGRDDWKRKPLQLEMFGEQLAGERFFEHLARLEQSHGAERLQVLEVFHMCLLLGFQGRFGQDGSEQLGLLARRLGDDLVRRRGRRAPFAPNWAPPAGSVVQRLRTEVPLWVVLSAFALVGLLGYLALNRQLAHQVDDRLKPYARVVQVVPQAAQVTITLP